MANREQLARSLAVSRPRSLLLLERNYSIANDFPNYTAESVYCLLPGWVIHLNINDWVSRANIWNVRQFERSDK